MDFSVDLSRAWAAAYPSEAVPMSPELAQCLKPPDPGQPRPIDRLEAILNEISSEAAVLEAQAQRKRFICNFLDRLLLKLSRQPQSSSSVAKSSSSSPNSPLSPVSTLPRVGKASLISPVVPRGTLIRVKDALRESGLLLDAYNDEDDSGGEMEGKDDDLEELEGRMSRATSGSERRGAAGREGEGDDDSLDDYLMDAFSGEGSPLSEHRRAILGPV